MNQPLTTAPALPVKEIRWDRVTGDFELLLDGVTVGWARSYFEGETTLDRLVYDRLQAEAARVEELNALGEPMPASEAEALARQLVGELNEYAALGLACDARYEAKSAQVRRLGYDIGPDAAGRLCLYDAATQQPLATGRGAARRAA